MGDTELVSCLCLTRHRVRLLARAVACFLHQSYPARELVIVYESDDVDTREYVGSLNDPRIRPVEVAKSEGLFLGGLRNRSIDASRGHYVAQWDDDDWHAPGRLEAQIESGSEQWKAGVPVVSHPGL